MFTLNSKKIVPAIIIALLHLVLIYPPNCFGKSSLPQNSCLSDVWVVLKKGGFSGPLICQTKAANFELVGSFSFNGNLYHIYNYRYKFKPENGNVYHGGQRIIFISSHGEYLGQYNLSTPPTLELRMKKNILYFYEGKFIIGHMDLKNGPPGKFNINMDNVDFFK